MEGGHLLPFERERNHYSTLARERNRQEITSLPLRGREIRALTLRGREITPLSLRERDITLKLTPAGAIDNTNNYLVKEHKNEKDDDEKDNEVFHKRDPKALRP